MTAICARSHLGEFVKIHTFTNAVTTKKVTSNELTLPCNAFYQYEIMRLKIGVVARFFVPSDRVLHIPCKAWVTELHPSQTQELGQRDRADDERREVRNVGGQQGIRLNVGRFGEQRDRLILDAQQVGACVVREKTVGDGNTQHERSGDRCTGVGLNGEILCNIK